VPVPTLRKHTSCQLRKELFCWYWPKHCVRTKRKAQGRFVGKWGSWILKWVVDIITVMLKGLTYFRGEHGGHSGATTDYTERRCVCRITRSQHVPSFCNKKARTVTTCVRFEVFTAVTMKNCVFWDVTPCGSCKNRRFGGN
jgi:hypothetical protein